MARIRIPSNARVATAGKTGSGKTVLNHQLCADLGRLVVLDPKGTIPLGAWNLTKESPSAWRQLEAGLPIRILVRWTEAGWNRVYPHIWKAGDVTLYIDEVYGVVPKPTSIPVGLTALYTRGRERGIGVYAAFQRPVNIPRYLISESEWFFCFRLQVQDDRDRMAEVMGPEVRVPIPKRDRYGFYVYHNEWEQPRYVPQLQIGASDVGLRRNQA